MIAKPGLCSASRILIAKKSRVHNFARDLSSASQEEYVYAAIPSASASGSTSPHRYGAIVHVWPELSIEGTGPIFSHKVSVNVDPCGREGLHCLQPST